MAKPIARMQAAEMVAITVGWPRESNLRPPVDIEPEEVIQWLRRRGVSRWKPVFVRSQKVAEGGPKDPHQDLTLRGLEVVACPLLMR